MDIEQVFDFIESVAEDCGYSCYRWSTLLEIDHSAWHSVAYKIKKNSSGYLQVHPWENMDDNGNYEYGRAIYSLRTMSDVAKFCALLVQSNEMRAKKKE